jgi:hypothetical protein
VQNIRCGEKLIKAAMKGVMKVLNGYNLKSETLYFTIIHATTSLVKTAGQNLLKIF